jgi:hypothetical protein
MFRIPTFAIRKVLKMVVSDSHIYVLIQFCNTHFMYILWIINAVRGLSLWVLLFSQGILPKLRFLCAPYPLILV